MNAMEPQIRASMLEDDERDSQIHSSSEPLLSSEIDSPAQREDDAGVRQLHVGNRRLLLLAGPALLLW